MFGIKKLQRQNDDLSEGIIELYNLCLEIDRKISNNNIQITKHLSDQKIDLSKINTRFHDLGEKIDKNQNDITKVTDYIFEQGELNKTIADKIVTDDAIMQHIKELNEKMTFLFDYMKQLEKLLGNVEIIVDQCLPELTLKLPKKKKPTS